MHPKKTYELRIAFSQQDADLANNTKQILIHWLIGCGEESFVEGVVDGLDVDFDYENPDRDMFVEAGGNAAPLSIYRYDVEYLQDLQAKIEATFQEKVLCSEHWLETEVWLEGWKSSFRAFHTEQFLIYPPWDKESPKSTHLIPIEIEPGMAFGTGQHATTQLCLRELERLPQFDLTKPILDVGTGTAILAIALAKLGYNSITATDIDPDAVNAAKENIAMNHCQIEVLRSSVPENSKEKFSLVIANILMVVIRKIARDMVASIAPEGYLLVSGVLDSERLEMRALGESLGLSLCRHQEQDGWVSMLFQRQG
ncbi:MAG: 50S ribosomal protein L11 methyltransferase [Oligoflexus sp.]